MNCFLHRPVPAAFLRPLVFHAPLLAELGETAFHGAQRKGSFSDDFGGTGAGVRLDEGENGLLLLLRRFDGVSSLPPRCRDGACTVSTIERV